MRIIKILSLLCTAIVVSIAAYCQAPSTWPNKVHTPTQYDKVKKDSVDIIPRDTIKLNVEDSGAIAYKGGKQWLWNGYLWLLNSGGNGGSGTGFSVRTITSSNFSTGTNCPLPALDGDSLQIFWNDLNRFLVKGTDWDVLGGGGFSITVPGFDAGAVDYSFTVYASPGTLTPGPLPFTSSDFISHTDCSIPALNGMTLQIFWNDLNRYLTAGTEWTPLAGGGFTVTVPGFDATTASYSFYVFNQ